MAQTEVEDAFKAAAELIATPKQRRGRKPGSWKRRPPTEGNLLWREYSEFGTTIRDKFLAELADKSIPYETFIKHSRKDRLLGSIPASNLVVYREFFYWATDARIDLYKEIKRQDALPSAVIKQVPNAPDAQ